MIAQRELINLENFLKIIYEKQTQYTPDRIPSGAEQGYSGRGGKKLKAATTVAYRSHESIRDDSIPEFTAEKGIRVEDMHDENVLMDDEGNIFVVDPVIYLDDEGKKHRITSSDPLLHEL